MVSILGPTLNLPMVSRLCISGLIAFNHSFCSAGEKLNGFSLNDLGLRVRVTFSVKQLKCTWLIYETLMPFFSCCENFRNSSFQQTDWAEWLFFWLFNKKTCDLICPLPPMVRLRILIKKSVSLIKRIAVDECRLKSLEFSSQSNGFRGMKLLGSIFSIILFAVAFFNFLLFPLIELQLLILSWFP